MFSIQNVSVQIVNKLIICQKIRIVHVTIKSYMEKTYNLYKHTCISLDISIICVLVSLDNNSHLKTKIKYTVSSHDQQTQNHCIKHALYTNLICIYTDSPSINEYDVNYSDISISNKICYFNHTQSYKHVIHNYCIYFIYMCSIYAMFFPNLVPYTHLYSYNTIQLVLNLNRNTDNPSLKKKNIACGYKLRIQVPYFIIIMHSTFIMNSTMFMPFCTIKSLFA